MRGKISHSATVTLKNKNKFSETFRNDISCCLDVEGCFIARMIFNDFLIYRIFYFKNNLIELF